MKSLFYELLYWNHLNISQLLDPTCVLRKISSLWRHISIKNDTLCVRRDLIFLNTKKKHWLRKESKGEVGPSWSFKEGDVLWILKNDKLSLAKDVIFGVKEPSLYGSNLHRCFIIEYKLPGLISHYHLRLCYH
jgi:hypothetical protein